MVTYRSRCANSWFFRFTFSGNFFPVTLELFYGALQSLVLLVPAFIICFSFLSFFIFGLPLYHSFVLACKKIQKQRRKKKKKKTINKDDDDEEGEKDWGLFLQDIPYRGGLEQTFRPAPLSSSSTFLCGYFTVCFRAATAYIRRTPEENLVRSSLALSGYLTAGNFSLFNHTMNIKQVRFF